MVVSAVRDEVLVQSVGVVELIQKLIISIICSLTCREKNVLKARLTQRTDDYEEKASVRLDTFKKHSEAVDGYYTGKTARAGGNRDEKNVFVDIRVAY